MIDMRRMTGKRGLGRRARSLVLLLLLLGCAFAQAGASPMLAEPTASGALQAMERDATTPQQTEYVPGPASAYALRLSDLGDGFSAHDPEEGPGGLSYKIQFQSTDVKPLGPELLSNRDVSFVTCSVELGQPGADDEVGQRLERLVDDLKRRHRAVTAKDDTRSSDQAVIFTWSAAGMFVRGVGLQHRNAMAMITVRGRAQFTTPDRLAGLAGIVEERIHGAVQPLAPTSG